jgi:thioredoxin 1
MGKLPPVKDDTFESEVLQADKPVLVDFGAEWCGPCKAIEPTLAELANEYEGRMKFYSLDVDQARSTAQRFGIQSVPTVILFHKGQVVSQAVGNRTKRELQDMIEKVLEG